MKNYSLLPFKPNRFPFFYGWIIVFAGTVGILFSIPGQTMGFSVFTDHLIASLHLNRDALTTAYLLGTIASSFILTYAGILYDRHGARITAIASSLFLAISLFLASYSPGISHALTNFTGIPFHIVAFILISILFFFIRFSGQGVLTLVSRNMMMKWFDKKRGRANAISSVFVSLGFAISPLLLGLLIDDTSWNITWRLISLAMIGFTLFAYLFYRDNPEACHLVPDGKAIIIDGTSQTAKKQFTLKEAIRTWGFWVFTGALSFYSFFGTGFTFNIVSIFESFGYTKTQGLAVFLPISIVSVSVSILGNFTSDFIKLQYLLFTLLIGALLSTIGFINLDSPWGYYMLIAGFGLMGGLFIVLVSVTWPRFFGRKHLGAISGLCTSSLVFSSAIGPLFFSRILTLTNSYVLAGEVSVVVVILLLITGFKATNPQ